MRKEFAVSLGVLLLLANSGLPQEPKTPSPAGALRDNSPQSPNPDQRVATIDHLLKAAEHLEAAGRTDEATTLRDEAKRLTLRDDLLSRKEAELECLQQEVDHLRALVGRDATVLLELVTVEVDRRKLGLKARDFDKLIGWTSAEDADGVDTAAGFRPPAAVANANPSHLPLFKELREKGALRILSEPKLVCVAGRPSRFLSGGEIPLHTSNAEGDNIRYAWFGTRIEVVSVLLPDNRIRMHADVELRSIAHRERADDGPADTAPFTSRRFQSQLEMRLDQTLTLFVDSLPVEENGAEPAAAGKSGATETITFITPRLARPRPEAPILPVAAEGDLPVPPPDFSPEDWQEFGPPMPVLKRRTPRN